MIGIVVVAHAPLAQALVAAIAHVYKRAPDAVVAVDVQADEPVDAVHTRLHVAAHQVNQGAGVLVFSDMCGATPANCARRLVESLPDAVLVHGVGLPALLRSVCYRQLPLQELADKAIEGAQRGCYQHIPDAGQTCPVPNE